MFATASLRQAMTALAQAYERQAPGGKVQLVFEGGAALLARLNAGERCDVVALADSSVMSRVAAGGHLKSGSAAPLARNRLAIAVAPGNPKRILRLADLAREDVQVALGAPSSSIGRHSRWMLSRDKISPRIAAQGDTAEELLPLLRDGKVDAALVYVTTFRGAEGVEQVAIPEDENTPALYSISVTRLAPNPTGAEAFRALAIGPEGRAILRESGFLVDEKP